MRQKCLMLGAGFSKQARRLKAPSSASEEDTDWTTLDINVGAKPDVVFDLNRIERWFFNRLPFKNDTFHEIHAYEVLEHYGTQGNYKGFFRGMREFWRVLKPDGHLIGTCPSYGVMWAWGDPGHTRIICEGTLMYLTRHLAEQLGQTAATDYIQYVKPCWWEVAHSDHDPDSGGFRFALKKLT